MSGDIKKPNFFIIGAPKCGTSSMSEYLRGHPNVFFSDYVEPNYFATDFSDEARYFTDKEEYLKVCFTGAQGYKRVGEGSVRYLYSKEAIPNILEFNPEAKFIAMVRDPVEMFHSLHSENLRELNETVEDPQKAWRLQEERKKGKSIPSTCYDPKWLQYGEVCKLGKQIKRLYNVVPEGEKVKIIRLEELGNNPKQVYEEILDFLGLKSDDRKDFPVCNPAGRLRIKVIRRLLNKLRRTRIKKASVSIKRKLNIQHWPFVVAIKKFNKKIGEKPPLEEDFRRELEEYFKEDQELLNETIEKD